MPASGQSIARLEPEAADVAAPRHALGQLDLAAAEAGEERQIELADLGILHRELVEDAVVRLDRRRPRDARAGAGVIAELVHHFGELLDLLPPACQPG